MEHVNLSTRCCVVGQLNPGAQRHVRSARITTRFWKARRLYLNNLQKKMAILQKSKYLLRNLVIKQKMCKNTIVQIATNYKFLKTSANSNI